MTVLAGDFASNMKDEEIIMEVIRILEGLFPEEVRRSAKGLINLGFNDWVQFFPIFFVNNVFTPRMLLKNWMLYNNVLLQGRKVQPPYWKTTNTFKPQFHHLLITANSAWNLIKIQHDVKSFYV